MTLDKRDKKSMSPQRDQLIAWLGAAWSKSMHIKFLAADIADSIPDEESAAFDVKLARWQTSANFDRISKQIERIREDLKAMDSLLCEIKSAGDAK